MPPSSISGSGTDYIAFCVDPILVPYVAGALDDLLDPKYWYEWRGAIDPPAEHPTNQNAAQGISNFVYAMIKSLNTPVFCDDGSVGQEISQTARSCYWSLSGPTSSPSVVEGKFENARLNCDLVEDAPNNRFVKQAVVQVNFPNPVQLWSLQVGNSCSQTVFGLAGQPYLRVEGWLGSTRVYDHFDVGRLSNGQDLFVLNWFTRNGPKVDRLDIRLRSGSAINDPVILDTTAGYLEDLLIGYYSNIVFVCNLL